MAETQAPVETVNLTIDGRAVSVPKGTMILEAAENCPVSAIFVEDADTGERLFP